MDAREYENLDRVEERHWYYAGKRELVRRWIAGPVPGVSPGKWRHAAG